MLLQSLGGRQLRALTSLLALVLAAVVLSGALGAGAALLVAGRGLATDVASVGPSVNVQSSSGGSPTAFRAATSEDRSALAERDGAARPGSGAPTAATRSRTTASVLEQRGDGSAAGAGQEGESWGGPSQSEQGGASEPPTGPSPGVPVENEEPSEESPGEDGESEGSEEGPGEDDESEGSEEGPGEDDESEGSEDGRGEDDESEGSEDGRGEDGESEPTQE
jgi:hypothetical protein